MKRFSTLGVLLIIVMFFMIGCTTGQVQVDQDSQETIAKIAARRAGYELESHYPEISHEVLGLSKAILIDEESDIVRIVVDRLAIVLAAEIDDPLLAADLQDIIALIKIDTGLEITAEQMAVIKAVATGLVSGIEIAQK